MKRSRSRGKKYLEPEPVKKGPAPQHCVGTFYSIGGYLYINQSHLVFSGVNDIVKSGFSNLVKNYNSGQFFHDLNWSLIRFLSLTMWNRNYSISTVYKRCQRWVRFITIHNITKCEQLLSAHFIRNLNVCCLLQWRRSSACRVVRYRT